MSAVEEDVSSVYYGSKTKMDPFAAAPSTPLPLKYLAMSNQFKKTVQEIILHPSRVNTNSFLFFRILK